MISFVKLRTINYIITKFNSFDNNIIFAFKEEDKGTLPLFVLIQTKDNSVVTTIF